ncbi:MAG TPA: phosphatase PAP2 family protein [Vicinamibacterales bacterium]|nr:phosphatase PAP2 family protein [Vicinamibacterales bacterium]
MSRRFRGLFACTLTLAASLAITPPAAAQSLPATGLSQPGVETSVPSLERPDAIFTDLFKQSAGDFRNLPSKDNLKWLGIGGLVAGLGAAIDQPTSNNFSQARSLDAPFQPGATIGGARFQLASALATYTIGHAIGNRKAAQVGGDLLRAQILSQAITAGVKWSVGRTRPDGTMYSFPSGHSSVTFASATVLQRNFGWKVGIPGYAVATYVAASRVQEKRHFFSDVAFGAAVGIVSGRTVTIGRGESRFALAPMAAPGGGGVSFSWVGNR